MPKPPSEVETPWSYHVSVLPALTGIPRSGIYVAIRQGALVARKFGRRKIVLRADLEAFLQNLEPTK